MVSRLFCLIIEPWKNVKSPLSWFSEIGLIVSKVKLGSAAVLPSIVSSVLVNNELKPSSNAWIVLSTTVSFNLSEALLQHLLLKMLVA